MTRYGLFCFLGRGHLDPGLAIARGLQARGHAVTVFHITIAQDAVRRAGLQFGSLDQHERRNYSPAVRIVRPTHMWRPTIDAVMTHAARTLAEGPAALRAARIDAVIADQLDVAAGSVAEWLDIPFISLSCGPPLYLDESVPPPYLAWPHASGEAALVRNRRGNALVERLAAPVLNLVNAQRRTWKMPNLERVNQLFSTRGIVTQLPAALEFPRAKPPHLFYTAQFRDTFADRDVKFDWDALDRRPLVYASMGTIRNTSAAVFRMIAEACSSLDVQLIMSLGGGRLRPATVGPLAGNPVVVYYAPQRPLIERASVTVCCSGLNTALDSVGNGVPIVAIPVAEDQPGVAARIVKAGIGLAEPAETLTVGRLRTAIVTALSDPQYRESARRVQRQLATMSGAEQATNLIERLVGDTVPVAGRRSP